MGEKPLAAVRKKPNSSVVVGLTMQKHGQSDAFLSAGNTGAILAASTVLLGLHDGVERATVATLFPTGGEPVLVLDGGANLDCSAKRAGRLRLPRHRRTCATSSAGPTRWSGLLNVGEEEEKGTAVVREAHQLLKQAPRLTYVGNIEGRDILPGPQQPDPRRRGRLRRVRRQHRAQVLRVGGAGLRRPDEGARPGRRSSGRTLRELVRVLDYSDLRRRAAARRPRRLDHLPRLLQPQRHQERHPRGAAGGASAGLSGHIAAEFAQREPAARS